MKRRPLLDHLQQLDSTAEAATTPDLAALLAEGRAHDAAMTEPPWHAPMVGFMTQFVVVEGTPPHFQDGKAILEPNLNYRDEAERNRLGLAWLGTHRRQLLDLAEEALRGRSALAAAKAAAEHVCTEQCSPCLGLHPGRAKK